VPEGGGELLPERLSVPDLLELVRIDIERDTGGRAEHEAVRAVQALGEQLLPALPVRSGRGEG